MKMIEISSKLLEILAGEMLENNTFLTKSKRYEKLTNKMCQITYDKEEKEISGMNLITSKGHISFGTTQKRGLKEIWPLIIEKFHEKTNMMKIAKILQDSRISIAVYYD